MSHFVPDFLAGTREPAWCSVIRGFSASSQGRGTEVQGQEGTQSDTPERVHLLQQTQCQQSFGSDGAEPKPTATKHSGQEN